MAKIKIPSIIENADDKKEYSYFEENEINANRPLRIGVQAPYEIINLTDYSVIISTNIKNKNVNEKDDPRSFINKASRYYNPFEEFDMEAFLNTVMDIDLTNPESILNFYNNYGPLGFDGMGTNEGNWRDKNNRTFGLNMDTSYEFLDFFKEEITLIQHLIHIYEAIQSKDEHFLRNFKIIPQLAYLRNDEIDPKESKENVYEIAKRAIKFSLNKKSNLINTVVELVNDEFTKLTTSSCLLGVFYTRLFELVAENSKIRKCQYCGNYFIPRKNNANFCPPPEANEKSKCVNRYDSMVRRITQWYFKDGLTVEEIQDKITKPKTRTIKEIQAILDNYKGKLKK